MFEVFLFINPVGIYCYDIERRIQRTINELNIDVSYHLVPIANVHIVQDDMIRRKRNEQKLCGFSFYTLITNKALEYYHAIKIANGNKKARSFLFELQSYLNKNIVSCDYIPLFNKAMTKLNIKIYTIESLLKSDYIKDSIEQDQKLAANWNVKKAPTTVIFNETEADQSGILIENMVTHEELVDLFQPKKKTQKANQLKNILSSHLRLI